MFRFLLLCFLAAELRTWEAKKIVSLDAHVAEPELRIEEADSSEPLTLVDNEMSTISDERRRWGWFKKMNHFWRSVRRGFTCDHNCWFNNWRHRDWRARGVRSRKRCHYRHFHGICYCYGR